MRRAAMAGMRMSAGVRVAAGGEMTGVAMPHMPRCVAMSRTARAKASQSHRTETDDAK